MVHSVLGRIPERKAPSNQGHPYLAYEHEKNEYSHD
jgi:hypothetical protein